VRRLHEATGSGLTAEAAVKRIQSDMRAQMVRRSDPLFRERMHDLDDLSNRLLRVLAGLEMTSAGQTLQQDAILIARTMGPADLLDYDRRHLVGLVLEDAGVAAHVTVIARALGLATVGGVRDILNKVQSGDLVAVDGLSGDVHLRPSAETVAAITDKIGRQKQRAALYQQLRDKPARTRDGLDVSLSMNAGLEMDLPHLDATNADGIGLYRTELQFMIAERMPRLEELRQSYGNVLKRAGSRPVIFRTLDIGGDKILPYLRHVQEENPALGWRAIRFALDRPAIFRTQVRALLQAAGGHDLNILLPMIADIWEVEQARELINREIEHHQRFKRPMPSSIRVGSMIEVPALLWQLEPLLKRVDFVSIGSNDLQQFLFAVDRTNMNVAQRFDALSLPLLKALKEISETARAHGVPVSLCGEMASRPLEAMTLVGLGITSLSLSPMAIGPVKAMLHSLVAEDIRRHVDELIGNHTLNVRTALESFARRSNVDISGL
jgi:phosphotransferase system enzyme I (PtsP)